MIQRRLCFVGLLLLASFSSSALGADKKLIDYREIVLDNGLKVVSVEDFSAPVIAVHLWYHVGSKDEQPSRQGFAHMFEHMMFQGTDKLGPTGHFDNIRRVGGDCNAYTAFDQTVYVETLPANQLELALWLEAERMTFLRIDQKSFDTERKVVEEERRMGSNRPFGSVPEHALEKIFKVHPYRWSPIGQIPHLRAATVAELRDFWTRFYVPNNATLVVVGGVKHEDVQRNAKKYFGWIPKYADPKRVTVREPVPQQPQEITLKEQNAPVQVVGYLFRIPPSGSDDTIRLQLLASILGGGESSRLYREIVVKDQAAEVALSAAFSLEHEGMFAAGAALSPFGGDPAKVYASIEKHIKKLIAEPVTEKELTKARNQMLMQTITQSMGVVTKAQAIGSAAVIEGNAARVNRPLEVLRDVTAAQLQEVARKYLVMDHVYKINIERNLLGTLMSSLSKKADAEEDSKVTAIKETNPPAPGRDGLTRPKDFPTAAPAASLATDRPKRPQVSKVLSNGMKVYVIEDHEAPIVHAFLGSKFGAFSETKPGTANLAMGMLTKGSAKHTEAQLSEELDSYAISLGGSATMDSSSVNLTSMSEYFARGVELMAEVVTSPKFSKDEFDRHSKQVKTGLAITSTDPSNVADREMRRRLYGQHPYSRTPTGESKDLDAVKATDVQEWWSKFLRPDAATLIITGDIKADAAFALAESAFKDWKANGSMPEVKLPEIPAVSSLQIYLVDRPSATQCQIRASQLAIPRTDPNFASAQLVTGYFGGDFGSRLNETIRVKRGLTYGASGGFGAGRFGGSFRASTFSKTQSTAEAVKAVIEEVDRLAKEPPSAEELDKTKSAYLGSYAVKHESVTSSASDIWLTELEGLPSNYHDTLLESVSKVCADDCTKLIRSTVSPSRMVVVVVGSAAKIKKDLEAIAPVTVVK